MSLMQSNITNRETDRGNIGSTGFSSGDHERIAAVPVLQRRFLMRYAPSIIHVALCASLGRFAISAAQAAWLNLRGVNDATVAREGRCNPKECCRQAAMVYLDAIPRACDPFAKTTFVPQTHVQGSLLQGNKRVPKFNAGRIWR